MDNKEYVVKVNKAGLSNLIEYIDYTCPNCSKRCNNPNALTKHFLESHQEKVFVCRSCPKIFQQLTDLFLHARQNHSDPEKPPRDPSNYRFHCDLPTCNYMTNNGGTFEHHRRAHTKEKPFACEFCDKRFSQKTNRNTHQSRHNSEKIFPCGICQKQFKTYDIYLSHLRTREHELREHSENVIETMVRVTCLGCGCTLTSLFDIKNHTKTCSRELELEYRYKCDCSQLVKNLDELKQHLRAHKDIMTISCPICKEDGFDHMNKLNHHITRTHALRVQRKHVCRYCESTFSSAPEMRAHVAEMHDGEVNSRKSRGAIGRFLCDRPNCDFTANTEMHMRSHRRQHDRGIVGEDGQLEKQHREPMKRGRKRKLPDTRDIFQQLCGGFEGNSEQAAIGTDDGSAVEDVSASVLMQKRKRGRPKKEVTEAINASMLIATQIKSELQADSSEVPTIPGV